MSNTKEIESKKVNLSTLFSDYWFRVPEYQRSYVWGKDQIDELLDDLNYAFNHNPNKEYFLGSVVLQKQKATSNAVTYDCCDILDGQQRMTTLFILMSVLRDIGENPKLITNAKDAIYQEEDPYSNQPERIRIEFLIRDAVSDFVETFIKADNGTLETDKLQALSENANVSLSNMAKTMLYLTKRLTEIDPKELDKLAIFLFNKVIVIYVASESLEDAFRLFTILNDRGIPLSNSDILKSLNIGEVKDDKKRQQFASMWENLEGEFGRDEFDRFLGHIRTILLKEKPRENLLKEYEKIYKAELLKKGEETLKLIRNYRDTFTKLIWFNDETETRNFQLKNLVTVMLKGLSSDWIPPYLFFYTKFGSDQLLPFLERLESKFTADWILQETPTKRLVNTYSILKAIEQTKDPKDLLLNESIFEYDKDAVRLRLEGNVYHTNFGRYILLKLEYLMLEINQGFAQFNNISVEHVLPQNPSENSSWVENFTLVERENWTHKLANLVLLSRIKNSQLNNKDFIDKKNRYFASSINVFPNIGSAMQNGEWTNEILTQRQENLVNKLMRGFK